MCSAASEPHALLRSLWNACLSAGKIEFKLARQHVFTARAGVALRNRAIGLKTKLLEHTARGRVIKKMHRHDTRVSKRCSNLEHGAASFGGVALAPMLARDPITKFGAIFERFAPVDTDATN